MDTPEAVKVLRDLALDDLLDEAQRQAVRMAIAALADVAARERQEREQMRRWMAGNVEEPAKRQSFSFRVDRKTAEAFLAREARRLRR